VQHEGGRTRVSIRNVGESLQQRLAVRIATFCKGGGREQPCSFAGTLLVAGERLLAQLGTSTPDLGRSGVVGGEKPRKSGGEKRGSAWL